VADWDNTESREHDEDAAWRDLVARFDAPLAEQQPVPWPEREDVPPQTSGSRGSHETHAAGDEKGTYPTDKVSGQRGGSGTDEPNERRGTDAVRGTDGLRAADGPDGLRGADGPGGAGSPGGASGPGGVAGLYSERGADGVHGGFARFGTDGSPDAFDVGGLPETHDPDVIQTPRQIPGPAAGGGPAGGTSADEETEHFIPPAPPPLPRLDPMAKGAWAALFGGPGYLVVATAAGWSVPGIAAFCAVAAFVAGFVILVLRMNEPGPGGPDDGDDGAVV
jgi:hypothetical protein